VGVKVILFAEGKEVGQIIGPVFDRIDENGLMQFKDLDGDGLFDPVKDLDTLGSGLPDYTIGLNNVFKWGNLDLNFFFRGVFGHSLLNVNNAKFGAPNAIAVQSGMKQVLDYADAIDGPTFSNVHVENASFVKLDNVSIGYTFNTKNKMIKSARVYLTGQNLLTFTKYTGIDPEVRYEDGNSPLSPGIDRENTYVRVRGFSLGLDLKF
jgi:iron complex outermembrane receptor protein